LKPQLLALLTAAAWGIGGYFEKRGLVLGNRMVLTVGGIILLTIG
jgi:transporter family protein